MGQFPKNFRPSDSNGPKTYILLSGKMRFVRELAIVLVLCLAAVCASGDVTVDSDGVSLFLDGIGNVHAEWLRERCLSPMSVDQVTLQRLYGPHEYEPPRVLNATLDGDELSVTFTDLHSSVFNVEELRKHAGEEEDPEPPLSFIQFPEALRPELELWDSTLTMPPIIDFDEIFSEQSEKLKLYTLLQSVGVVVARGAPLREKVCSEMAANLSTLRVTEWGENFNVVSTVSDTPGTKRDLAYTPQAIGMHTDNPYRYPTPDFQLLHVIEQCECDEYPCEECYVHNYFVDGFAIAEKMAKETPELFDALATVPVRFENNGGDGTSALWHETPHFELKPKYKVPWCRGAKCVQAIRFSSKSGGYAPRLPPNELEVFYKAKRRFSELAHDPKMYIHLQLRKGDVAIFDNTRLLHARSSILPGDGNRFVQGCYLDRDGVQYHYERTRRALARPTWTKIEDTTQRDVDEMAGEYRKLDIARNLKEMLDAQAGQFLGQPVDLREHGLQTASRAFRAGESDDIVVAALFHDVTEHLVPKNHGEAAAAILAPYVDEATHWILSQHEVFQGYYYFDKVADDPNKRDALQESPHWELARRFCEEYDQTAFDPSYPSLPIDFFLPIINRVVSRKPYWWNPDHLKAGSVVG